MEIKQGVLKVVLPTTGVLNVKELIAFYKLFGHLSRTKVEDITKGAVYIEREGLTPYSPSDHTALETMWFSISACIQELKEEEEKDNAK